MLTGYNTDVSYEGEIFHIQTEDKGIHSPIILSLVYRAGTILAAKRTSYGNLIENGVVDETGNITFSWPRSRPGKAKNWRN
jgi:hypothetical protein